MKGRREFLKDAARSAILLGAQSGTGLARILAQQSGDEGKSRVVVARGTGAQSDEKHVLELLDKALMSYFGRQKPIEAWQSIGFPNIWKNRVVGVKVNGAGGKAFSTHAVLVQAICERLRQAGVSPGNIVVWDRDAQSLEACGLKINTDRSKVRCFGCDVAGYEKMPEWWGVARVRLSKILTQECAIVINVPILADDENAGLSFSMKSMLGGADKPETLVGNHGNPGVADLNCIPLVRSIVCLTIGDAISSMYDGGPTFNAKHLWYPNALIVGEDRVAVDTTAWQMLDKKRVQMKLPTLAGARREPKYIETAADAKHQLGTNDPNRIKIIETR